MSVAASLQSIGSEQAVKSAVTWFHCRGRSHGQAQYWVLLKVFLELLSWKQRNKHQVICFSRKWLKIDVEFKSEALSDAVGIHCTAKSMWTLMRYTHKWLWNIKLKKNYMCESAAITSSAALGRVPIWYCALAADILLPVSHKSTGEVQHWCWVIMAGIPLHPEVLDSYNWGHWGIYLIH